jgi:hypothetical protein
MSFSSLLRRDNAGLLRMIEFQKQPYVFTSTQLLEILSATTSVKTRVAIIQSIGPRLTDPQAKKDELMGLFRYAEEKLKVEEVLKAAWTRVSQQQKGGNLLSAKGGGAGRGAGAGPGANAGGGRGGMGGRAPAHSRASAGPSFAAFAKKLQLSDADEKALSLEEEDASSAVATSSTTPEATDDSTDPKSAPKKKASLVITKRAVTVKSAAEIAQEKLEAEIIAAQNAATSTPGSTAKRGGSVGYDTPGTNSSTRSNFSNTSTPIKPGVSSANKRHTVGPRTIAEMMKVDSSSSHDNHGHGSVVANNINRHPHDHPDAEINDEINAVLKMLDMDKSKADTASTDLEVWEMMVVTNRTVETQFGNLSNHFSTKLDRENHHSHDKDHHHHHHHPSHGTQHHSHDKDHHHHHHHHPHAHDNEHQHHTSSTSTPNRHASAGSTSTNESEGYSATPSRYSSAPDRTLGQKRMSFQFYTGMFSAARSAYTQAVDHLNKPENGSRSNSGDNTTVYTGEDLDKIIPKHMMDQLTSQFGGSTGLADLDEMNAKCVRSPKHQAVKVGDLKSGFKTHRAAPLPPTSPAAVEHHDVTISSPSRAGNFSVSKRYKDAARPSFSLGMDPEAFLAMIEEQPIETNADGLPQFTYKELVRRNYSREYGGLIQTDLEIYLNDGEFVFKFGMSKVRLFMCVSVECCNIYDQRFVNLQDEFAKLPLWKRVSMKKALSLF